MKKQMFTLHTLRLRGTKLFFTSRTFVADHYVPEDQSHLPTGEQRVDYPEHYVADEFAEIVYPHEPGVEDSRRVYATDIGRHLILKTYPQFTKENVMVHKISMGEVTDEDPRIYHRLRLDLEKAIFEKKASVRSQIASLQEESGRVDNLLERAVMAKRPKLNGGDK